MTNFLDITTLPTTKAPTRDMTLAEVQEYCERKGAAGEGRQVLVDNSSERNANGKTISETYVRITHPVPRNENDMAFYLVTETVTLITPGIWTDTDRHTQTRKLTPEMYAALPVKPQIRSA